MFPHFLLILVSLTRLALALNVPLIYEQMDQTHRQQTGLEKLSNEERLAFQEWIEKKYYQAITTTPKSVEAEDLLWIYRTEPFNLVRSKPIAADPFDEENIERSLALVVIFQDEARFLIEYIEFYKLMGVEHFYFYNNRSRDNYREVLTPYITRGEVELFEWPVVSFGRNQSTCYDHAVRKAAGKFKWLIVCDTDEFIFPTEQDNLIDFLKDYDHPEIGALAINWLCFGTSNIARIPDGELILEHLTQCDRAPNRIYKVICKPHRVELFNFPHSPIYKPGFYTVDEGFQQVLDKCVNNRQPIQKIRCNHYQTRDREFLFQIKALRSLKSYLNQLLKPDIDKLTVKDRRQFLRLEKQLSQSTDTAIHRFLPLLRERMR